MPIEIDENMQYEINLKILQAWDDAINEALGTGDRTWITDALLPDILPMVEQITRTALVKGTSR